MISRSDIRKHRRRGVYIVVLGICMEAFSAYHAATSRYVDLRDPINILGGVFMLIGGFFLLFLPRRFLLPPADERSNRRASALVAEASSGAFGNEQSATNSQADAAVVSRDIASPPQ